MNKQEKLQIINSEPNYQQRLKLLVDNGFIDEASQLVRALARTNTVMCFFEGHNSKFCRPLPRVSEGLAGLYIIITSSPKLDYNPNPQDALDHWYIIFELGWERAALGWTEDETKALVKVAMAHALARPINQWSLRQAQGTNLACQRLFDCSINYMALQITALYLVFHLRLADFGHICQYLEDVKGFTLKPKSYDDAPAVVNWIVEKLKQHGWTEDRIAKELLEWIHLKSTWPEWLLAVAQAKVFPGDEIDSSRAIAVRLWIKHRLGSILDKDLFGGNRATSITAYKELFRIGQFGLDDKDWIEEELVERMALGRVGVVIFFIKHFGELFDIKAGSDETALTIRAMYKAARDGNYGIAVALARCCDRRPNQQWIERVQLLQLPTALE